MVCNIRDGVPVLQIRAVAPYAQSIQIQKCVWRASFAHKTLEGDVLFKHEELQSHCPSFLSLPCTSTHEMDHTCPLARHFAATGKMPTNIFIVVSMGLWDVAKCRYFETSMRYSLDRDVAMGMTFENTVVRGFVTGAHEDAPPQINLRNFEVLKP